MHVLILILSLIATMTAGEVAAKKAQLAPLHIQYFELRDETSGQGYSLGRYYADRPNGFIHVEQNGHGGLKRSAWFYFTGEAFYEDGTPVPGTADDVLRIDLTLNWDKDGREFTFTMDELMLSGSSLHFDNGEPIDFPLTLPFDGPIGVVLGVGDMNFRNRETDTFRHFDGVQSKSLAIPGLEWEQATDGSAVDFVEIPLPEPTMLMSLAAGVIALVMLAGRGPDAA